MNRKPILEDKRGRWPAMILAASLMFIGATASAQRYSQHNLVSDVAGLADRTDPNLVNAWGIARSPSGPIWISNNGTGTSTVYDGNGQPVPSSNSPLVVSIPQGVANTEGGNPTGTVFNPTSDFVVSQGGASGKAVFLFAGEDGTISGWNPGVNATAAVLGVDNSLSGAVHKGIALGSIGSANFVYVANFHAGTVDVYDATFNLSFTFTDGSLPAGYAPFGIANIGGKLFVSFALQDGAKHDDVSGPGHGFVDVFDTSGTLLQSFAAGGTLNSPWGMTLAPAGFGSFSGALLVGNFGDGRINAFDPGSGTFLGQLANPDASPLTIDGLWGLAFGNGSPGQSSTTLYFTAGPEGESHGLFGRIQAVNGTPMPPGKS